MFAKKRARKNVKSSTAAIHENKGSSCLQFCEPDIPDSIFQRGIGEIEERDSGSPSQNSHPNWLHQQINPSVKIQVDINCCIPTIKCLRFLLFCRHFWSDLSHRLPFEATFTAYSREKLFQLASSNLRRNKHYHSNEVTTVLLNVQSTTVEQLSVLLWEIWLSAFLLQMFAIAICLTVTSFRKHSFKRNKRNRNRFRVLLPVLILWNLVVLYAGHSTSMSARLSQHNLNSDNSSSLIFQTGVNNMIKHWLSRPNQYKANVLLVADFQTSTLVESAIRFASEQIGKQVSVSYVGSPIMGYTGIRSWFSCPPVLASYMIVSRDEGQVIIWESLMERETASFYEGQFPMDAMIFLSVGSASGKWFQIHSGNVQHWLDEGLDYYIRGTESRTGRGRAYISHHHNDITWTCLSFPQLPLLNKIIWDGNTPATFQHKPSSPLHPNILQKSTRL